MHCEMMVFLKARFLKMLNSARNDMFVVEKLENTYKQRKGKHLSFPVRANILYFFF